MIQIVRGQDSYLMFRSKMLRSKNDTNAIILSSGILLESQLFPSNPSGQLHKYVSSPVTVQVPPFWQGLFVHGFTVRRKTNSKSGSCSTRKDHFSI